MQKQTYISRRNFIGGTMAFAAGIALTNIEGNIFSATPAHATQGSQDIKNATQDAQGTFGAQDTGGAGGALTESGAQTNIIVVRPTELGIVAYDLTDAKNPMAVPDCHVTITSRYNKKSIEGTTNAEGKVVLDIAALAEENSDSDIYAFNGSIEVRKEGYREVNIPLARICGHNAFVAPTRPLNNLPYFRSLTFNEWDVQYMAPEFLTSASNTETHKIQGALWLPDGLNIQQASLVKSDDGTEQTIGTFNIFRTGFLNKNIVCEILGDFLNSGKDVCLGEGSDPKIVFGSTENMFETAINIDSKPAVAEEETEKSEVVVPSTVNHTYKAFVLPKTFPKPLSSSEFNLWQPTCPFICQVSAAGIVILGYGKSTIRAKSDTGKFRPAGAWKTCPTQSFFDQLDTEIKKEFQALDNYKKQVAVPNSPNKTKKLSHKFTSKFSTDVTVQAFASLIYNRKKEFWRGALSGVFVASANALWTVQCTLMFIPVFLQVGLSVAFNASLYLGAKAKDITELDNLECTPEKTFGFGINLGLSIAAGVGVAGFVSVSTTASGYVSYYINFLSNPDAPSPRMIAGYGAKVYVTLQIMLFKYSFSICDENKPQAYDSAKDGNATSINDVKDELTEELKEKLGLTSNNSDIIVGSGDMPSFAELMKNAVIVTNKEMLCSREFKQDATFDDANLPVSIEFVSFDTTEDADVDDEVEDLFNNYYITVTPNDTNSDGTLGSYDFDNPALPTYEYVGTMTNTVKLASTEIGVEGISDNSLGGIKPTYDELLFENITSNPKLKILTTIYGLTVMFRIATVEIGNGAARSRLVYHILKGGKWSEPNVVEFDPGFSGVSRNDMYDFDFDVAQGDAYDGANYIFLNVTSGTRPRKDATTFKEGVQARYATIVCLYDSNFDVNPLRNYARMTCGYRSLSEGGTLISPAISVLADPTSVVGTKNFCVMASIIGKSVDEKSMNNPTGTRRVYFARWEKDTDTGYEVFRVDRNSKSDRVYCGSPVLFPTVIDDEKYDHLWGSCAKDRRVTAACVGEGTVQIYKYEGLYSENLPWKQYFVGVRNLNIARSSSSAHYVDKIWKFGQHQGFLLGSCKTKDAGGETTSSILKLEFDPKNNGSVSMTQIGSVAGGVSDFTSDPEGHYLFFAENIDGKTGQDYVLDENGEPTGEVKDIVSHKYYIKAMAHVDGLFTKPFVFAELDHAADWLAATCVNGEYITFMVDDITDMSKSISNLYDVRVPIVKCITPLSLASVEPFCFSGRPAPFSLEVRNDGNLVATGATFKFMNAESGDVIESKTLKFSDVASLDEDAEDGATETNAAGKTLEDNAASENAAASENTAAPTCGFDVASLSGSGLENNILLQNSGQNVLLPGDTRAITLSFNIPEGWGGEKRVRVEVSDIQYISPTSLIQLGDDDEDFNVTSYHIPENDTPTAEINIFNSVTASASNLATGEVKRRGAGEDGEGGGSNESGETDEGADTDEGASVNGGANSAQGTTTNSAERRATPNLSDFAGRGTALLAAAAATAAAAGFMAYSAQGSTIERTKTKHSTIERDAVGSHAITGAEFETNRSEEDGSVNTSIS